MTWTCPKCKRELRMAGAHTLHCGTDLSARLFWKKVEKTDSCWLYRGFIKWDGYGWVSRYVEGKPRQLTAHRYAWILTHGEPPEGAHILHTCDNPPCCNPSHLRLGTHQENMADRVAKGRHMMGRIYPDRVRPKRAA